MKEEMGVSRLIELGGMCRCMNQPSGQAGGASVTAAPMSTRRLLDRAAE